MPGQFFERISIQRKKKAVRLLHVVVWPLLIAVWAGGAGLRLNLTNSVPVGLYRITGDPIFELVEFCPPEPFASLSIQRAYRRRALGCADYAEPLLKPIVAREGDLVTISSEGIAVNCILIPNTAPKPKDSTGRDLAHWPFGQHRVAAGLVWVASAYNENSFDSRYFGPISLVDIKHRLRPVWTTHHPFWTHIRWIVSTQPVEPRSSVNFTSNSNIRIIQGTRILLNAGGEK